MKRITSIILSLWACTSFAEPTVLASIRPLAMIAEAVVESEGASIGRVEVLLPPSVAHHYSLTVSDRRKLQLADWFVWVGEPLEGFLADVVKHRQTPVITASELNLSWPSALDIEHGSADSAEEHGDHKGHNDKEPLAHDHGDRDPHLWLNPMNATVIARALADDLSAKNPENAEKYQENAIKFGKKMMSLDEKIRRQLAPVKDKPFIVYHPAYGHFVEHFNLNQQGFIVHSAEQPVSAKRLIHLSQQPAVCVLGEIGQPTKTVSRLASALDAGVGTFDPLGQQGQQSVDQLIQMIADELLQCLSDKS